ncbi:hypothetical protein B0T20DRAFT_351281 [Sordaria brevicollis]|uniref:Uncharacterized protein n=1 Tax=Sordaria brevicollis TaxID=83679 RepID=A0AAE0PGV3_SORBR|nr:hypothetical protein B0T20DRAFT_351281 [Sordaria brevicollis]
MAPSLLARSQSRNMIDICLRHQWPPKTSLDIQSSGLDCLVVVMRCIVSYLEPQDLRNSTIQLAQQGDHLTRLFWSLVWMDFDQAGSDATDGMRRQFMDEFRKKEHLEPNEDPPFIDLARSDEAFMRSFWSQEGLFTLGFTMVREPPDGQWHQITERCLDLIWDGKTTLEDYISSLQGYRSRPDGSFVMISVFGAPDVLPVLYRPEGGQRIHNFYDQIRGFTVKLEHYEDGLDIGYRLIAVVRLRGEADPCDAVRLYRPNGLLVRPTTETDYFPTSWRVSSSEPYMLFYARCELPDMYDIVRYPELPANHLESRSFCFRSAVPSQGQTPEPNSSGAIGSEDSSSEAD